MDNKYQETLANIAMYFFEHTLFAFAQVSFFRDLIDEKELEKELSKNKALQSINISESIDYYNKIKSQPEKVKEAANVFFAKATMFKDMIERYPDIMKCFEKKMGHAATMEVKDIIDSLQILICPSLNKNKIH